MSEWLGTGLQNRSHQFESGWNLFKRRPLRSPFFNEELKMPTEKAKIGIFNDGFPPIIDGVTLTVLNYVDHLRRRDEEVSVVTPYNPVKIDVPYDVIRYFSLPIQSRHPYRYGYPKLDPFIWRRLRTIPFKIIHSHSPFSAGRLGVYAKRKQGIPLIGTFHSKYKSDLKHSFKLMPFCVPIIMKRILDFYNACDEVWIPQSKVEDTVREYGYKGKIVVMENGNDFADVPLEEVKALKDEMLEGPHKDRLNLLFVGQHIWEKGIGIIVDALELLKDDMDFHMTFIGDGYAKKELRDKIALAGLSDRVELLEVTEDRKALQRRYAQADLFLFPSRYDNAPLVVREAAAMGTPSIIPVGSTASEVIRPEFNGFLAEDTPEAYARQIRQLSGHRELIQECGLNARRTLVRGWTDVMNEVYDRYNQLIQANIRK